MQTKRLIGSTKNATNESCYLRQARYKYQNVDLPHLHTDKLSANYSLIEVIYTYYNMSLIKSLLTIYIKLTK